MAKFRMIQVTVFKQNPLIKVNPKEHAPQSIQKPFFKCHYHLRHPEVRRGISPLSVSNRVRHIEWPHTLFLFEAKSNLLYL
jgi:hypothetical protein